jgi:hypothetical protein
MVDPPGNCQRDKGQRRDLIAVGIVVERRILSLFQGSFALFDLLFCLLPAVFSLLLQSFSFLVR